MDIPIGLVPGHDHLVHNRYKRKKSKRILYRFSNYIKVNSTTYTIPYFCEDLLHNLLT